MSFEGSGVDTTEVVRENGPKKSVEPGVQVLAIADVEYVVSTAKGTPGIKITLMSKPVEGLMDDDGKNIGQKCVETMWMSAKAWNNEGSEPTPNWATKARLSILADKLGVRTEFDAAKGSNAEEFVKAVTPLFKGKKARFAVGGEEESFVNDKDETINFVRVNLLTFKFVESLTDVPKDSDTELVFDPNNSYHYKKMAEADMPAKTTSSSTKEAAEGDDELPW